MSNAVFGMLLLSILTGVLVVWDLEYGPGAGILLLAVEIAVAVVWLGVLVLR